MNQFPKVILMASISADGFIAQSKNQSSLKWTSKEDTQFFVKKTKEVGTLIMGSTTFATIGRPLPERQIIVLTRSKTYDEFDPSQVRATGKPIRELLGELFRDGVGEVVIAGGTSVYTQFMQEDLVDEIYLTIEPVVFGSGLKLFDGSITNSLKLSLLETLDLSDQTKVFHYKVIKGEV
jgi:dihydrofolate reductase